MKIINTLSNHHIIILILVAAGLGSACGNQNFYSIPDIKIDARDIGFVQENNILLYNRKPFSGIQFILDSKKDTALYASFYNGKAEGRYERWFENGKPAELRWYHDGRKSGTHKKWYPDGHLRFEAQMADDHYEGYMKTWFDNGQLYQYFNYKDGQEQGMEHMWKQDGTLIANYESKNGRKYGLTGVKGCQSLWTDRVH